jgi:reactive intermediate/imine deaminase
VKRTVETDDAPAAVGAYSQATTNGDLVFTAGQVPLTPDGERVEGGVAAQTRRALSNVEAVLAGEGAGLAGVLKTTVYLRDGDDFDAMNRAYAEFFDDAPPARSAVVAAPPVPWADVEVEAVAVL